MAEGAFRCIAASGMDETAIVLNYTKIRDNSMVLHALVRSCGRRSFIIRTGPKAKMAFYLPMNILELSVSENPRTDLCPAVPVSVKYPLIGIRNDIYKNSMSMFMSEVLYRTLKDGASEEGLFDWCERQILTLDALKTDFSNFHIRFLLEFCVALGFRPEASDLAPFTGLNQSIIEEFMRRDFAESMLMPMTGQLRNDLASAVIKYLENHTESSINIRSLQVLRELFS